MSSMDSDKRKRHALVSFGDEKVRAALLEEGQLVALTMIKVKSGNAQLPLTIIMNVIEASVGPETWPLLVGKLASGEVGLSDFTAFLEKITKATVAAKKDAAEARNTKHVPYSGPEPDDNEPWPDE